MWFWNINVDILCFPPSKSHWKWFICYCRSFLPNKQTKKKHIHHGGNNDQLVMRESLLHFHLRLLEARVRMNKDVLRWSGHFCQPLFLFFFFWKFIKLKRRFKEKDGKVAAWSLLLRVLQVISRCNETIRNFKIHAALKLTPMYFLQNCTKYWSDAGKYLIKRESSLWFLSMRLKTGLKSNRR